ncbi:MFS transporter [Paenibacillus sp. CAU 1782]
MTSGIFASQTNSFRYKLVLLLAVVIVAGMSQGLLLPLLSILLEDAGIPADQNGMNSVAMYIGVFGMMFFVERPVRAWGYKKVIIAGIALVACSVLLFPLTSSLAVWFVLRLLVGVGDSALHYATQLWIVSSSPAEKRGRYISLYGMAYGLGFSIGPLGINLLQIGRPAPFLVSGIIFLSVMLLVFKLPQEKPEMPQRGEAGRKRYLTTYRLAWFALIPAVLFGLVESSMNSTFPLYGLRTELDQHWISLLLLAFGAGSLILQLPLGILSDRAGRKPVLMLCGIAGSLSFLAIPFADGTIAILMLLFIVAGGAVGSFFSLGLAYAADILPKEILPAANVAGSIHFSIGSILGPLLGGYGLSYLSDNSVFLLLGSAFLLFSLLGFAFRPQTRPRSIS